MNAAAIGEGKRRARKSGPGGILRGFDRLACFCVLGLAGLAVEPIHAAGLPVGPLSGARQQEEEKSPQAGPLDEVAQTLSDAIGLDFNGGELQAKFPDQAAGQALYTSLLRFGGGGGSSSGGNNWRYNIRGNKISGIFGNGTIFPTPARDRPVGSYLHLVEKEQPFRQVHLDCSGREIQVLVIEPAAGTVLRLRQAESGAVLLQMVTADQCVAHQASSFNDLWFEHSTLLGERFFPLLRKLGVGTPAVDLTEKLQAQVLNDLAYGASKQAEFLETFRDLEADDFELRAKATERLEAEFSQWSLAIARGIRDPGLNAEVRARLRKVFSAKASADEKATAELMDSQQLDSNPRFLVRLLADCRSPEETQLVLQRLREIAEQDLGSELATWQAWAEKFQPSAEPPVINEFSAERPLQEEANYFRARVELARLVRLTADEKAIKLDREFWKARYGGKSIAELAEGVRQQYQATNLPRGWMTLGDGYDLSAVDYPQVLFEDVVDQLVQGSPYSQSYYINRRHQATNRPKTLNREFDIQSASGELELHPENRAQPNQELKEEYFKLNLREMNSDGSLLTLEELPSGAFSLCFVDQAMDLVLLISKQPDQPARIGVLRGAESLQLAAPTPLGLFAENRDVIAEKFNPLLRHAGIDLSEALGGPLKIEPSKSGSK
ncbi:MAG: hypothetical protein ACK557_09490 [Planctomycetota bacterium]